MKEMIYYPGFEVRDINWIKFALLYFEEIRPIIPYMPYDESSYLSPVFLEIMNKTNLIRPYRPGYEEGACASTISCNEFDKYLRQPQRYSEFFGYRNRSYNLVSKWQNPKYQSCTLFEGKYSHTFFDYCIENKIATPCNEGINISEDLAFVYMSFLADIISKNNELEMITDIQKYSSILMLNDKGLSNSAKSDIKFAQSNIEFNLPMNIEQIPLEHFIKLRSQRNFNECRKGYMNEIEKLIEAKEQIRPDYSLEELLSYKKDFIKLCEKSFDMVSALTITVHSAKTLIDGNDVNAPLLLATAYMDYRAVKDMFVDIPEFIEQLKNKHFARRYLAKLSKFKIRR